MNNHKKKMRYHYIYKTTNLINGNEYIGVHSTNNINDGYMGSGFNLKRAIRNYGAENFSTKVMKFFYHKAAAYSEEERLVNSAYIKRRDTYNIVVGGGVLGSGPDHPSYGKPHPYDLSGEKNPNFGKRGEKSALFGRKYSAAHRAAIAKGNKGKKISEETLIKISESNRSHLYSDKRQGDLVLALAKGNRSSAEIREFLVDIGELNPKTNKPYSRTAIDNYLKSVGFKRPKRGTLDPKMKEAVICLFQKGIRGSAMGIELAKLGFLNNKREPYHQKVTWSMCKNLGLI